MTSTSGLHTKSAKQWPPLRTESFLPVRTADRTALSASFAEPMSRM